LRSPKLLVVQVDEDPVSAQFVYQKKIFAQKIGVLFEEKLFTKKSTTEEVISFIKASDADGIVVQLPLPESFDTEKILASIPQNKDVDALSPRPIVTPPVAGAVEEILDRNDIEVRGVKALVVGKGRLVGLPVGLWLESLGAEVQYADKNTDNLFVLTRAADLIVSGAGVPELITPEMVKDGVVLIDAGTSESLGKTVGDCDPACATKAKLFTPVPGGVGPVTVAMLFKNLVELVA
jgi:methylenetetrahydrofolate dehydrogenase (NADP+) / methenyltetrahydrofolate cyclohydrolase